MKKRILAFLMAFLISAVPCMVSATEIVGQDEQDGDIGISEVVEDESLDFDFAENEYPDVQLSKTEKLLLFMQENATQKSYNTTITSDSLLELESTTGVANLVQYIQNNGILNTSNGNKYIERTDTERDSEICVLIEYDPNANTLTYGAISVTANIEVTLMFTYDIASNASSEMYGLYENSLDPRNKSTWMGTSPFDMHSYGSSSALTFTATQSHIQAYENPVSLLKAFSEPAFLGWGALVYTNTSIKMKTLGFEVYDFHQDFTHNTIDTAYDITLGEANSVSITGYGDTIYFKVNMPKKGVIMINATPVVISSGYVKPAVAIYNSNKEKIWSDTGSIYRKNSDSVVCDVGVDVGTYYVMYYTTTSGKGRAVVALDVLETDNYEAEPNNSATTSNAIQKGVTYFGNYAGPNGDYDYYTFPMTVGRRIKITFHTDQNIDIDNTSTILSVTGSSPYKMEEKSEKKNGYTKTITFVPQKTGSGSFKVGNYSCASYIDYTLNISDVMPQTYWVDTVGEMQSPHPYPCASEDSWIYCIPNAKSLKVVFSKDTSVEKYHEYIKVYDKNFALIGSYTGTDLAGKAVIVPGDKVKIQVVSEMFSGNYYGFAVDSITAYDEADKQPDSQPDKQPDSQPDKQPDSQPDKQPGSQPSDDKKGSEEQITAFVSRMYTEVLNRNPDNVGLNTWVGGLKNGTMDGASLARGFICSDEFTKRKLSNYNYLVTLYKTFFNRKPDAGGMSNWTRMMNSGVSRNEVLAGFVNSQEFANLCDSYGIARGTMEADGSNIYNAGVRNFVLRIYTKALKREGETAGVEDWSHRINTKAMSPEDVAKSFFSSQEFINKNLNNADYVETLYETFMGRASDAGGKADWVGKLNAGMSRTVVLEGFSRSQEFSNIMKSYGL